MLTPYQPTRDHDRENTSTTAQPPTPLTPLTVPDAEIQLRRPPQGIRQGYRPAHCLIVTTRMLTLLQMLLPNYVGWDTHKAHRSLQQMFALARRMGSAPRHGPVGTTPRASALAAANSGICSLVAHEQMHHYHSNRRVGIYSLTIVNREMVILNRETLSRPGPHPHRSARTSFGPHFIFTSQPVIGFFIT